MSYYGQQPPVGVPPQQAWLPSAAAASWTPASESERGRPTDSTRRQVKLLAFYARERERELELD
ncbi:hypothetical protein ZEAMMB73_Zm00001d006711 [Zea mays]|uniref:Uncharacterized protein n=1 Tax=Zea mays TaxID=4577 RepID=A0A1D6EZS7_MAIZE|nr:hypothetical protein ZEAMMB73_Zm00001d006711 [Zea mays]